MWFSLFSVWKIPFHIQNLAQWTFFVGISFIFVNWRIIALQCFTGFCYPTTWINYMIHVSPPSRACLPPPTSQPSRSSQSWAPTSHLFHTWMHAGVLFATPWTVAHQAPLSMGFSRQPYWTGLPFPPPGDLPNPGIKSLSFESPALAGRFFTTWEAPNNSTP